MITNGSDHTLDLKAVQAKPASELPHGTKIDRYLVLEVPGKGGMGVVYKAYDTLINRGVALKLIRIKDEGLSLNSEGAARLLREAQALAQLNHPNAVKVHDAGTIGDHVFVGITASRNLQPATPE